MQQLSLILKQQITPHDSVFLNVQNYEATSGDLFQYYNQDEANPDVRESERQEPILGWMMQVFLPIHPIPACRA